MLTLTIIFTLRFPTFAIKVILIFVHIFTHFHILSGLCQAYSQTYILARYISP